MRIFLRVRKGTALVAVVLTITVALSSWALASRGLGSLVRLEGWADSGPSKPGEGSAAALGEGLRLLHRAPPAGTEGCCKVCPETGQQEYLLRFTRQSEQPQTWRLEVERAGPHDRTALCRDVYPELP